MGVQPFLALGGGILGKSTRSEPGDAPIPVLPVALLFVVEDFWQSRRLVIVQATRRCRQLVSATTWSPLTPR